jgi:hypothetical protein
MTRFLFSVWQLRISWCGAPSLTRGWVSNLLVQLLLGLARAVTLGSKPRSTHDHILLSHLILPQPGGQGISHFSYVSTRDKAMSEGARSVARLVGDLLCLREITGKWAVQIVMKYAPQTKKDKEIKMYAKNLDNKPSLWKPMNRFKFRIRGAILQLPAAPSEEQKLNIRDINVIKTHKGAVTSYWSLWVANLIADQGITWKRCRNWVRWSDWLSMPHGPSPCICYTCCYSVSRILASSQTILSDM